MSQIVIVTAIGARDKPGIVAALTEAVYEAGGSLDDATMTRLHGAFATMLAARMPDDAAIETLRQQLIKASLRLELHVEVDEIPDAHEEQPPDHLITVYGADRPGIVHQIASALAAEGVNITDLDTRVAGASDQPVYVMFLETAGGNWQTIPAKLSAVAKSLGVEIGHKELDAEAL
jgi:glycine cleavage system transcriptional repressor